MSNIRKKVLRVSFMYDADTLNPDEWPLEVIAREISSGDCIGTVENVSDEALTREQVRATEIEWDGDGTFMLGTEGAADLIDRLRAKYPNLRFEIGDGQFYRRNDGGNYPYQVIELIDASDVAIINPLRSPCSRFEVDPQATYGISREDALAIAQHNGQEP